MQENLNRFKTAAVSNIEELYLFLLFSSLCNTVFVTPYVSIFYLYTTDEIFQYNMQHTDKN